MKNQKFILRHISMRGFTLMELMIVVAIIGILAGIAYPSYTDYIVKSKRKEGQSDMLQIQLGLERWRANNSTYSATLAQAGFTDNNVNYDYQITAGSSAGSMYTITATAQGAQSSADSSCASLTINHASAKGPSGCWGN